MIMVVMMMMVMMMTYISAPRRAFQLPVAYEVEDVQGASGYRCILYGPCVISEHVDSLVLTLCISDTDSNNKHETIDRVVLVLIIKGKLFVVVPMSARFSSSR